jgi:hypothetical protein
VNRGKDNPSCFLSDLAGPAEFRIGQPRKCVRPQLSNGVTVLQIFLLPCFVIFASVADTLAHDLYPFVRRKVAAADTQSTIRPLTSPTAGTGSRAAKFVRSA